MVSNTVDPPPYEVKRRIGFTKNGYSWTEYLTDTELQLRYLPSQYKELADPSSDLYDPLTCLKNGVTPIKPR